MRKYILLWILFLSFGVFAQGNQLHRANKMHFRNNSGDTTVVIDALNSRFGIGLVTPINYLDVEGGVAIGASYSGTSTAPTNGLIVQGDVRIGTDDGDNDLDVSGRAAIGVSYATGVTAPSNGLIVEGRLGLGVSIPQNPLDVEGGAVIGASYSGTNTAPSNGLLIEGNVGIGNTSPSQALDVDGYVERNEVMGWDAIAWFPPSDSGAVLDTLDNVIEVLGFYHNTDSVNVFNTWQTPPYFTQIDSMKFYFEAPNTSGDSLAIAVETRAYTTGEAANGSFTAVGADTIDLGTTARNIVELTITGFSGISAGDIVDFRGYRDTSISQNVDAVCNLRRTEIYWQ